MAIVELVQDDYSNKKLLGAPGRTTSNKKLHEATNGAPGIATNGAIGRWRRPRNETVTRLMAVTRRCKRTRPGERMAVIARHTPWTMSTLRELRRYRDALAGYRNRILSNEGLAVDALMLCRAAVKERWGCLVASTVEE